jgi:hypothetical protein
MTQELQAAWERVGGLSNPSKMPCYGYSTSAKKCRVGSKLRLVENSVCSKCYAMRGNYPFPVVQNAMERRMDAWKNSSSWVPDMVFLIQNLDSSGFFRWLDSGDIQSLEMLEKLVDVVISLPQIQFWLPTKEYRLASKYIAKHGAFPKNLTVRLSGYMIDGGSPSELATRLGVQTSAVSREKFDCPSSYQSGKCLTCRKCWDKKIANVTYKAH